MKINVKNSKQSFEVKSLAAAAAANKFPDVILTAGGVVYDATVKAKIKIKATYLDGGSIKTWKETVAYLDVGGGILGHMFEGKHITADDWDDRGITVSAEIDVGQGYVPVAAWSYEECQPAGLPGIYTQVLSAMNDTGVAGCAISLQVMI